MCVDKIKKFFSQIDVMYHLEVASLINLYITCILSLFINKWLAFAIGNIVTIAAILIKEFYDKKHPDSHSFEVKDIIAGLLGLVITDIPLICVLV